MMIQPMKTRLDDDPANEGKIGRWSGQLRWDQSVIQTTKAIILNARITHHLLSGNSIIKTGLRHFWWILDQWVQLLQ